MSMNTRLKTFVVLAALAAPLTPLPAAQASANVVQRACLQSDRAQATRSRCTCIGRVADQVLTRSDQRKGAKLFRDPHQAQEIRQSSNRSNEEFWLRWKAFGQTAQAVCS